MAWEAYTFWNIPCSRSVKGVAAVGSDVTVVVSWLLISCTSGFEVSTKLK